MRERFETQEDRDNQALLKSDIERAMSWKLHDLGADSNAHYTIDFFATERGSKKGSAWVEVKVRKKYALKDLPDVMLSAGKWRDGVSLSGSTKLPFYLFFRFTDGVFRYLFKVEHLTMAGGITTRFDGRTKDARDDRDSEPLVMIPARLWEPVVIPPPPVREKAPFELEGTEPPPEQPPF